MRKKLSLFIVLSFSAILLLAACGTKETGSTTSSDEGEQKEVYE